MYKADQGQVQLLQINNSKELNQEQNNINPRFQVNQDSGVSDAVITPHNGLYLLLLHSFKGPGYIRVNCKHEDEIKMIVDTYGSSRLKLLPLHPFVGLEATNATRIAITAQQTTLKRK